jgi:hypothetical protein
MLTVQAILTLASRNAGRALNMIFAWVSTLLFGKVPADRQIWVSALTFGSVVWLIVLFGVLFPHLGVFLLSFAPVPKGVNPDWIRWAMIVVAVILPFGLGLINLKLAGEKTRGMTPVQAMLRGWPMTLGLALTVLMMIPIAIISWARSLLKRWTAQHIPMVVTAEDYESVVADIQRVLKEAGVETRRDKASWMITAPVRVLTFFAAGAIESMVAANLAVLHTTKGDVEILLHPADLIVYAADKRGQWLRAVISRELTFTKAHLTTSKEAQEIEDAFRHVWEQARDGWQGGELPETARQKLAEADERLKQAELPFEEWDVLFREKMQVEASLLRASLGLTDGPQKEVTAENQGGTVAQRGTRPARSAPPAPLPRRQPAGALDRVSTAMSTAIEVVEHAHSILAPGQVQSVRVQVAGRTLAERPVRLSPFKALLLGLLAALLRSVAVDLRPTTRRRGM